MNINDERLAANFFSKVIKTFPPKKESSCIIVTHLLPDRPCFLEAVNSTTKIVSIIPKPKSIYPAVYNFLKHKYPIDKLSRTKLTDSTGFLSSIKSRLHGEPLVFLDIGGYFSAGINEVARNWSQFLGVVEDTENGLQKYQHRQPLNIPVISVARSPLKNPEDFLVGQSVVFSTEALLREQGDIMHGRTACVIGYGKLGRSIASLLHSRHIRTIVYDIDPIKLVEALSHGFTVNSSLENSLKGVGLIFCASGNISIRSEDFNYLKNGAYIVTVTSSDDELELGELKRNYTIDHISDYVTRYKNADREVYLLNRGQAVNFIHGAVVGPFIYLVQAEIIVSAVRLVNESLPYRIQENPPPVRRTIASLWYDIFGKNT